MAGIPEDIQTWSGWLQPVATYVNQDVVRWAFLLSAIIFLASLLPWKVIFLSLKKNNSKEPTLLKKKSHRPKSDYEEDFKYFAALKDADIGPTYTKLRELYRRGLDIHAEYSERLEHMFEHEDNSPADDQAEDWVADVYRELNANLPVEAFKFCPTEDTSIEVFSQFEDYLTELEAIIIDYGDKLSKKGGS